MTITVGGTAITFNDGTTQQTAGTQSLSASGYQKLPSGLIIQWGTVTVPYTQTSTNVTFGIAFPNACFVAFAQLVSPAVNGIAGPAITAKTTTGLTIFGDYTSSPVTSETYWFAIGN